MIGMKSLKTVTFGSIVLIVLMSLNIVGCGKKDDAAGSATPPGKGTVGQMKGNGADKETQDAVAKENANSGAPANPR